MNIIKNQDPALQSSDAAQIARIAIRYILLPDPEVVRLLDGAVFPVIRGRKRKETEWHTATGQTVMFDDNTTPRWALLWSHGCLRTSRPPGRWTFAHVWDESNDPNAYTHVANLVMMPECFGSLSDKDGPLVDVLRYHAQTVYKWCPNQEREVKERPEFFDTLEDWNYLKGTGSPRKNIHRGLEKSNSWRAKKLRKIIAGGRDL